MYISGEREKETSILDTIKSTINDAHRVEPCLKGNFKIVLNISSVYCEKLKAKTIFSSFCSTGV